jgi:hypothetical protein
MNKKKKKRRKFRFLFVGTKTKETQMKNEWKKNGKINANFCCCANGKSNDKKYIKLCLHNLLCNQNLPALVISSREMIDEKKSQFVGKIYLFLLKFLCQLAKVLIWSTKYFSEFSAVEISNT